ncbi:MAG: ligase-associated DNA damage response endonuclease PdeM [Parvibaculaceae bacterium]
MRKRSGWGVAKRDSIALAGLELVPDITGALYAPDYRALMVADLHFEKGSSRAGRGIHLPPYDTRTTLGALGDAVARWRPERLFSLGDSFHDRDGFGRLDAQDRVQIERLASLVEIVWLAGNHDPKLSDELPGTLAQEAALGPLTLRHLPGGGGLEIAGHLHPIAAVVKRGRRLSRKCFAGDGERLVMPAFGAYTGGLNVLADAFRPLFPGPFTAWMIGRAAIHAFPSGVLRG